MTSVQELYQARLAAVDQRVAGRLTSVGDAQTRFGDLLNEKMNPAIEVVKASPQDGDIVTAKESATDPMKAMMEMMSASLSMGSMSALGGGENGGSSSMGSSMNTMLSMMMMQLFDKLDKLAAPDDGAGTAVTAASEAPATETVTEQAPAGSIDEMVTNAALTHHVDSDLIHGVIQAESSYRTDAVSGKGAKGLMQLMPGTAQEMGVEDPLDAAQNIEGGVGYLARMLERFDGDEKLALAAYNCGPSKVGSYGITDSGDPEQYGRLPQSVRTYVENVQRYADERAPG